MNQCIHDQAEKKLNTFLPYAGENYTRLRNYDDGDHKNVSQLSKYIRKKILCEAGIVARVLEIHPFQYAEKYIQEICWRTYWRGWLMHYPSVWQDYRLTKNVLKQQLTQKQRLLINQIIQNNSEYPCMNTWSKVLQSSGYLHNHARMWFASIWVHTLKLPWQIGAEFFYKYLLDGDPASNTLSWRWVAGLHTKGKYYLTTAKNIEKFTEGKIIPSFNFSIKPVQHVSENHRKKALIESNGILSDMSDIDWIIHSDDLGVFDLDFMKKNTNTILFLPVHMTTPKQDLSKRVLDFDQQAFLEKKYNLKKIFGDRVHTIDEKFIFNPLKKYMTLYPGQGYTHDYFSKHCPSVKYIHRSWEKELFPISHKGFFFFWKGAKKYIQNKVTNGVQEESDKI